MIRVRVVSIGRIRYREVRFFVDFVLDFFITYILVNRGRGKGEQQLGDGGGRFEATESPSWSLWAKFEFVEFFIQLKSRKQSIF